MNYEERKKWILEHKDDFIYFATECENNNYNDYLKNYKEKEGKDYDPIEDRKFYDEVEKIIGEKCDTSYERHLKILEDWKDVTKFLNDDDLMLREESTCKEILGDIDLKDYLNLIRHDQRIENDLFLYIKNGKVIDKDVFAGEYGYIEFGKTEDDVVNKAVRLNADVYNVHNHPTDFAAYPSVGDKKCAEHLNKRLIKQGLKLLDWGVVTMCDYYSDKEKRGF